MNRLKRALLWATLIAIIALTCLSIYGACLGAGPARAFFNSVPAAVYWFVLAGLLAAGIGVFRRLRKVPTLLLMHLGCILVLLGGLWGSRAAHEVRHRLFGTQKILEGQMAILENSQDSRVRIADSNELGTLPFEVRLNDFRMEYYEPGQLAIESRDGRRWRLPAAEGKTLALGAQLGKVTVQRVFENFKIGVQGHERLPYDAPGGSNPAVEVLVEAPNEAAATRYVFEHFPGHPHPEDQIALTYHRVVSDYISELEIIEHGKVVAAKDIEVNHPLHYGGYHFYQHSYGADRAGPHTVLMVVSDSGLNLVYAGYAMLIAAIFWHFWGRRALAAITSRRAASTLPHAQERCGGEAHGD